MLSQKLKLDVSGWQTGRALGSLSSLQTQWFYLYLSHAFAVCAQFCLGEEKVLLLEALGGNLEI